MVACFDGHDLIKKKDFPDKNKLVRLMLSTLLNLNGFRGLEKEPCANSEDANQSLPNSRTCKICEVDSTHTEKSAKMWKLIFEPML